MNNLFAWLLTSVCWTLGIFCFYRAYQKHITVDLQTLEIKIPGGAFLIMLGIIIQRPDFRAIPATLLTIGIVNLITRVKASINLHNLNYEAQQDPGKGGHYQMIRKKHLNKKINDLTWITGFYIFLAILLFGIHDMHKIFK